MQHTPVRLCGSNSSSSSNKQELAVAVSNCVVFFFLPLNPPAHTLTLPMVDERGFSGRYLFKLEAYETRIDIKYCCCCCLQVVRWYVVEWSNGMFLSGQMLLVKNVTVAEWSDVALSEWSDVTLLSGMLFSVLLSGMLLSGHVDAEVS